MDEPLSNLDAKLRVQMRTEVSRIQSGSGTTTVYVTHDQTEAMTLGDRVAVMRAGVLQQVGTPKELYDHPGNLFVAGLHRLPGDELPARHRSRATRVKLPIGDVPLSERAAPGGRGRAERRPHRRHASRGLRGRRAGRRPARPRTSTSRRRSTWSNRWARSSTCTSRVEHEGVSSRSSRSWPQDAGTAEVPSAGEGARSSPGSNRPARSSEGEEVELWLDASKLHLFDAAERARASTRRTARRFSPLAEPAVSSFHSCVRSRRVALASRRAHVGVGLGARARSGRPRAGARPPARTRRRTTPRATCSRSMRARRSCMARKPQASTPSASEA